LALLCAYASNIFYLLLYVPYPTIDLAAIRLQLSLAGTARADATTELGHFYSASAQARQEILQLRQFHLQLSFSRAGMAGENIQDQLSAIDHSRTNFSLNIALLRSCEIMIEDQ
jgi:hypothetical protein